jgi:glycosyltransferase involved in cell wall biosynthesis
MDRSKIALVIPAFNEAASIAQVIKGALAYGHVIVVDDGSSDETPTVAAKAGATVVSHPHNQGYDAALNSGFKRASEMGFCAIITLDADGQHDPTLLVKFVAAITSGNDLVVGERNRRQRFSEYLFSWYTNLRFGLKDPLCGMKAYNIRLYRAMGHFDSYQSIGSELALFAFQNGWKTAQIYFQVRDRDGKPRFGRTIVANLKILRALFLSLMQ